MMERIYISALALILACVITHLAWAQGLTGTPTEKIVVSYPSRSITIFPILEIARLKGFFQREGLHASIIYVRAGIDIKALIAGDIDYAAAGTGCCEICGVLRGRVSKGNSYHLILKRRDVGSLIATGRIQIED